MTRTVIANVIAIDGPSGSGKSTIARLLAKELNFLYIDTGSMFRALASYCHDKKISVENNAEFCGIISNLQIDYAPNDRQLIVVNDEDYTEKIREHFVSKLASEISQIPCVRERLLNLQRSLAEKRTCVMEGRDIGSVVFPNAIVKFFVTASVEIRAKRRYDQLLSSSDNPNSSEKIELEQIIADIEKRDKKDQEREIAPLVQSEGAHFIDTSEMSTDEVLANLKKIVRESFDKSNK